MMRTFIFFSVFCDCGVYKLKLCVCVFFVCVNLFLNILVVCVV